MARVLILGAGVMGSALAVPARDNGHDVLLATTPLDADVLEALTRDRAAHPRLGAPLDPAVEVRDAARVAAADAQGADLVVVGVSSPGIGWAADQLVRLAPRAPVAIVTKGLVPRGEAPPETYADALPRMVAERGGRLPPLVGIGGPCIARELADRRPTAVVYASSDAGAARHAAGLMETESYAVEVSQDARGVEACAALKNLLAIGVAAIEGAHRRGDVPARNPVARAFQRAVDEMAALSPWLGGGAETARGLAGLGDLHVTVGGGRNSRLGRLLGEGVTIADALAGPMRGETVEGVDVGRALAAGLAGGQPTGPLRLTRAVLAAIEGAPFDASSALRTA
jgi:glycerol-3-phosphate dehydrogenase (NAD(P)+)